MMRAALRRIWARVAAYAAHDDPMVAACNVIALVVASNQPFYPLYVFWAVSEHITPTFFTFLSTPFFLAVPAIARWSPVTGRVLLPVAGMANTIVSTKVFGRASGVEIFLIPCALIPAIFFRESERLVAFVLVGTALFIFFALDGAYGDPIHLYTPSEYSAFLRLNAMSAGTLTAFIGFLASGLLSRLSPQTRQRA